jgi:hypothetical protein
MEIIRTTTATQPQVYKCIASRRSRVPRVSRASRLARLAHNPSAKECILVQTVVAHERLACQELFVYHWKDNFMSFHAMAFALPFIQCMWSKNQISPNLPFTTGILKIAGVCVVVFSAMGQKLIPFPADPHLLLQNHT